MGDIRLNRATAIDVEAARRELLLELGELDNLDRLSAEGQKTVELDQTSVGRLSRIDALQRQALAQESRRRRANRRRRIQEALERIERGQFGFCEECDEPIPAKRLEIDWTARLCVRCAK
jgi:DnaK suppressor protein